MASLLWHRGVRSPSPLILHFELHYSIGYCTLKPTNASIKCAKAVRSLAPCCMSLEVDKDRELPPNSRSGLEERFAVLNTGKWACPSCGYKFDEFVGDPSYPIAAGIEFRNLPDDWRCPTCGAAKSYFKSESVEVAGFSQNQRFGLGTNSLTAGQKSILIYGSLVLFFLLFLSGYFLQ